MPWPKGRKRPAAAERMRKLNADPEFKAAAAERMRKLHADPEFKAAHRERGAERMRKLHADPEFKAKLSALHADPEFKAAAAERMRKLNAGRWRPPAGYERLYAKARAIIGAAAAKLEIDALARHEAARTAAE